MSSLEAIRAELERIIRDTAAEQHHQLDRRETELAQAMELASQDAAVQRAWREATSNERRRVQALISRELQLARPLSPHRASLLRLSRLVEGTDA